MRNELPIKLFNSKSIKVNFDTKVINVWKNYRQLKKSDLEGCGVLIGGYIRENRTIIVESCTTPGVADTRRRCSYKMTDSSHQTTINTAFKKSNGEAFFIGTWHTHPEPYPTPSRADLQDWKRLMHENLDAIPAFLFAIVGTKQVSIFPFINGGYKKKGNK